MTIIRNGDGSVVDKSNPLFTALSGNTVVEQKTQADAVTGVVTFSEEVNTIEIYNLDATNSGVFTVNGINLTVPASKSFKATIGGVKSNTVTVTGSTSYILTRYE